MPNHPKNQTVEMKDYPSLLVATAVTGIGLVDDEFSFTFSDLQEFHSYFLGFPIWTHELASGPIMSLANIYLREAFPLMPTSEFAGEDPAAAVKVVKDAFGDYIKVKKGRLERPENPIKTLQQIIGDDKKIVVVATKEEE